MEQISPKGLREYVRFVREYRENFIAVRVLSEVSFLCPCCSRYKPFGGDNAVSYYNNARGSVLVCNDCLLEFELES